MSTRPMPQNAQTAAAIAARRARTAEMLQRVQSTLQRMRREKTPITYQAVARRARRLAHVPLPEP